jgi:hypothetical protein
LDGTFYLAERGLRMSLTNLVDPYGIHSII